MKLVGKILKTDSGSLSKYSAVIEDIEGDLHCEVGFYDNPRSAQAYIESPFMRPVTWLKGKFEYVKEERIDE